MLALASSYLAVVLLPGAPAGARDGRRLLIPVQGKRLRAIQNNFYSPRGRRRHNALDIPARRGTPVLAADDGTIKRISSNRLGGRTIQQFCPEKCHMFYYAHLQGYARGLREGQPVSCGEVIGYVGTSGNAPPNYPHLHFAVSRLYSARRWWSGTPINPFRLLEESTDRAARRGPNSPEGSAAGSASTVYESESTETR